MRHRMMTVSEHVKVELSSSRIFAPPQQTNKQTTNKQTNNKQTNKQQTNNKQQTTHFTFLVLVGIIYLLRCCGLVVVGRKKKKQVSMASLGTRHDDNNYY